MRYVGPSAAIGIGRGARADKRRLASLLSFGVALAAFGATSGRNPIEVGSERWGCDIVAALRKSAETHQPVFLLFQEVPSCAGCQAWQVRPDTPSRC